MSPRALAQPLRFGAVGIVNTALDLALFWLLAGVLGIPMLLANTLSYAAGVLNSFVMNRAWTFRGGPFRSSAGVQLSLFLLVSLVGVGVANLTLWLFAQVLPMMVAKPGSLALTVGWNFFASQRLVFSAETNRMIEELHDAFYLQRIQVSDRLKDVPRVDGLRPFCEGKSVLHIGCSQFPNTNPATNLHIQLAAFCQVLDGYDVATETYDILRPYVTNGRLLMSLQEAGCYDVVLIPEVLEHVANVQDFLSAMSNIHTRRYVITVPDLFQCYQRHFAMSEDQGMFLEAVHPDHNCWYSPYTITNTLRKYTDWRIEEICWFNRISLLVSATPGGR